MKFMQSYKRLDTLCRDMNGIGVTGYIQDMERVANGAQYASNWNSDYQKLKHYRHMRNQIAHEVSATEENMCSPEDTAWIEEFYQRILQQTDPLAIHYKEISRLQKTVNSSTKKSSAPVVYTCYSSPCVPPPKTTRKHMRAWIVGLAVFSAVLIVCFLIFLLK